MYQKPCDRCGRQIYFETKIIQPRGNRGSYRIQIPMDAESGKSHRCRRQPRDIPGQKLLFQDFDRCR